MNEIKNADELEAFIHEIDKGKMLRADEVEALKNSFAQSGMRREFLLKKISLEQEIEFERIRLLGKVGIEKELLEKQIERRRMELDAQLAEVSVKNAQARQEEINNAQAELKIKSARATTEAEIANLEREGDRLDLELGFWALEQVKSIKRKDEYERMLMELQKKEKELELEIKKIETLSKASVEALIVIAGPEQAAMLKGLRETEMLKGCTEEQILAMAAAKSPEVAKAFQEKFKGLSSEELKKLYERMIADKDKMTGETMKMIQEMYNKALETQRDVSVAAAQGRGPTTVYPPPGQPGFYVPPGTTASPIGAEVIICPKCKTKVFPGQKFCNNCGNEMF